MIHIDKNATECVMSGTLVELLDDLCNAATGLYASMEPSMGASAAKSALELAVELATRQPPKDFTKITLPKID